MPNKRTGKHKVSSVTRERYIIKAHGHKKRPYRVRVGDNHVGYFATVEEAIQARDKYLTEKL